MGRLNATPFSSGGTKLTRIFLPPGSGGGGGGEKASWLSCLLGPLGLCICRFSFALLKASWDSEERKHGFFESQISGCF